MSRLVLGAKQTRPTVLLLLLALLMSVGSLIPAAAGTTDSPAGSTQSPLSKVGELERYPDPKQMEQVFGQPVEMPGAGSGSAFAGLPLLSPASGRIYQAYSLKAVGDPAPKPRQVGVLVRDAQSLKILSSFKIRELFEVEGFEQQGPKARGALPAALDEDRKRIYFWINRPNPGVGEPKTALLVLDETSLTYTYMPVQPLADAPLSPAAYPAGLFSFQGITYTHGNLYIYLSHNEFGSYLIKVDPATAKTEWSRRIRGCGRPYFESSDASGYLQVIQTKDAIYVPCTSRDVAAVVRLKLSEAAAAWGEERVFVGRGAPQGYLIDPNAQRIHIGVGVRFFTTDDVVSFDVKREAWVGVQKVGVGGDAAWGLDPQTGRLYTHSREAEFGLSLLEGRRTPVPPGLRFPEFVAPLRFGLHRVGVLHRDHVLGRLYLPMGRDASEQRFWILEDLPSGAEPPPEDRDEGKTYDVPESALTGVSFSGEAAAYGARALLVGGMRVPGPNDHVSMDLIGKPENFQNETIPCRKDERELIVARVTEARVSNSVRSASGVSADADNVTELDVKNPSRCLPRQLEDENAVPPELGANPILDMAREQFDKLIGRDWPFPGVACTPEQPNATVKPKEAALGGFESSVSCAANAVQASATARPAHPVSVPPGPLPAVTVASASSFSSVRKDSKRGTVSVAESMVRGIDIGGIIQIEGIYARAETWAKGRPKTANSSYERVIWGVRAPGFSCGLCLDHNALAERLTTVLGANGQVTLPRSDPRLSPGSQGGYTSAIQRDLFEALTASLLNGDSLMEVPALEVILYNDHPHIGLVRRIFQFAGVKVNSQYGIFCLGGLPEDGECPKPPGASLTILLTDDSAEPKTLPGGIFELHSDADEDGVLGPLDPLVSGSTCITDAAGKCALSNIVPGAYIIHQIAAPAGYVPAPDLGVTFESGVAYTATVTNALAVGRIEITLTDDGDEPKPLEGGEFEVFLDDGDGEVGATDLLLATCVTTVDGTCPLELATDLDLPGGALEDLEDLTQDDDGNAEGGGSSSEDKTLEFVPLGAYVVRQSKAPTNYIAADDVAFVLAQPGALALLSFQNGLVPIEGTPPTPPEPPTTIPAPPSEAQTTVVVEEGPAPRIPQIISQPMAPQGIKEVVTRVIQAPAETLRFLTRNPREALLMASVWGLFAAPFWFAYRRRLLVAAARSGEGL